VGLLFDLLSLLLRSPEADCSQDAGRCYRPDVEAPPPCRHRAYPPPGLRTTTWNGVGSPLRFADGYSFSDQAISGGIIASNRQLELSSAEPNASRRSDKDGQSS
jgi:hypothetical protein